MTIHSSTLLLGSIFTDRLVLQRCRSNVIWGWDRPHQHVELFVVGPRNVSISTRTNERGEWHLECPELEVGGPYVLTFRGSTELTLRDVLVGEVWLASGQSNMEWPLAGALNAELEIASAAFPSIRLFTVHTQAADTPQTTLEGEWQECTPEHAEGFSAVGYFFARAIHERLNVPVGVINASWGGTPIEAWTSHETLQTLPAMRAALDRQLALEYDAPRLRALAEQQVLEWERTQLPNDPGNVGFEKGWAAADFDDSAWPSMRLPGSWQSRGLKHNGVVWFRRTVELPPEWVGRELSLSLGMLDDFDETYVNGVSVGAHPKGTPEA
jgi:sialate O-acetylesterase